MDVSSSQQELYDFRRPLVNDVEVKRRNRHILQDSSAATDDDKLGTGLAERLEQFAKLDAEHGEWLRDYAAGRSDCDDGAGAVSDATSRAM